MPYQEDKSLDIGFDCDAKLEKGAIVKLSSDGDVDAIAAATDLPLGVVSVGNSAAGEKLTVKTGFVAVSKVIIDTDDVVIGDKLSFTAWDATNKLTKVKKSLTTNYISAIALTAGGDTDEIMVGILRTPIYTYVYTPG